MSAADEQLDGDQMDEVFRVYVAIESDCASEEETFGRLVALFNHIYAMGQERERQAHQAAKTCMCLHHWHVYAQGWAGDVPWPVPEPWTVCVWVAGPSVVGGLAASVGCSGLSLTGISDTIEWPDLSSRAPAPRTRVLGAFFVWRGAATLMAVGTDATLSAGAML